MIPTYKIKYLKSCVSGANLYMVCLHLKTRAMQNDQNTNNDVAAKTDAAVFFMRWF